ncbi:phosphoenolpyruvate--protein phosphotransferase [uncultured Finegoldia sp.]|uniref:phosphoenolpyruvate--protein phosphotransferase n=1 Tax=uncultured Finegoldia sp. TaxID=328009 RepID=UPI002617A2BE|nr:phosphoenolpyruvate--protein phosphotransferase [uncultured Finegoldia sp.]
MNLIKEGIIASEQIAIGKVKLMKKQDIKINTEKIPDEEINNHIKKFKEALEAYKKDLANSQVDNDTQKEVIEAHLSMLDDPFLSETVISKINEKNSSDKALDDTINEMVDMMQSLDNEYMRERASDYKDIGKQLMYKIKGIKYEKLDSLEPNTILVSKELTPYETSIIDKDNVVGFLMDLGGKTAHTSIIAQTLGIACLVGMKDITSCISDGQTVIIDSFKGICIIEPDDETLMEYRNKKSKLDDEITRLDKNRFKKAVTVDGKAIDVMTNIGNFEDLEKGLECGADGVGLFRTEFLYMYNSHFPTEDEQFEYYKKVVEKLEDKSVIIRTLDIGGDKELPYYKFPKEDNPFLGWRALRFCFDMEDVFDAQIKAILRASAFGKIKIMLPMIISVDEIEKALRIIEKNKQSLKYENIDFDENIEVGIMIETPASVMVCDDLVEYVDFFSIGTNDLTQYILATDRGNEKISNLYNTYNPAVLRAIKRVIDVSHQYGKWTGMCGGFAADTRATKLLLGMGLDEFSAPASAIAKIKDTIANNSMEKAGKFADEILKLKKTSEIEKAILE